MPYAKCEKCGEGGNFLMHESADGFNRFHTCPTGAKPMDENKTERCVNCDLGIVSPSPQEEPTAEPTIEMTLVDFNKLRKEWESQATNAETTRLRSELAFQKEQVVICRTNEFNALSASNSYRAEATRLTNSEITLRAEVERLTQERETLRGWLWEGLEICMRTDLFKTGWIAAERGMRDRALRSETWAEFAVSVADARVSELTQEIETQAKAYGLLASERDYFKGREHQAELLLSEENSERYRKGHGIPTHKELMAKLARINEAISGVHTIPEVNNIRAILTEKE